MILLLLLWICFTLYYVEEDNDIGTLCNDDDRSNLEENSNFFISSCNNSSNDNTTLNENGSNNNNPFKNLSKDVESDISLGRNPENDNIGIASGFKRNIYGILKDNYDQSGSFKNDWNTLGTINLQMSKVYVSSNETDLNIDSQLSEDYSVHLTESNNDDQEFNNLCDIVSLHSKDRKSVV